MKVNAITAFTDAELLAELGRRLRTPLKPGTPCRCGPLRREIVEHQGGCEARTGCLNCDQWDGPVVLSDD